MRNYLITYILLSVVGISNATICSAQTDRTLPWVTSEIKASRIVFRTFQSKTVGANVSYHVYLPKDYEKSLNRFPVLYWLHGTEGGLEGIRPLSSLVHEAIESGKMPGVIVVFVNGLPRRLWSNSKNGSSPVETVFINEVIPDVDKTFRTRSSRAGRIIEGFSMGGYGAARLGFKYPNLFAGISVLAGGPLDLEFAGPRAKHAPQLREEILKEVCSGDVGYFKKLSPWQIAATAAASLRSNRISIRMAIGNLDNSLQLSQRFHLRLDSLNIPHQYFEVPDVGHDAVRLLEYLLLKDRSFYFRVLGIKELVRRSAEIR
jgi:enterochelin esterase-like enzyme